MNKKLLSLLMACLMVMSFAVIANAEKPTVTITVGTVDGIDATGNISVPIYIDNLPCDDISSIDLKMTIDYTKIQAVTTAKGTSEGDIPVGEAMSVIDEYIAGGDYSDYEEYAGDCSGTKWNTLGKNINTNGTIATGYADTTGSAYYHKSIQGENTVATYYVFKKVAGAEGFANISVSDVEFTANKEEGGQTVSYKVDCDVVTVAGGITCSEVVEPDPEPVATTVKTFAKRLYLDNTLYTVGVVTEGDDYVAADVKAGINIVKGEGTVNYWTNNAPVSDKNGTSYFVVALTDITEDTEITADSASKALLVVGDKTLEGAAVSANSTSVDDKVE